jgi:hypothetical protein
LEKMQFSGFAERRQSKLRNHQPVRRPIAKRRMSPRNSAAKATLQAKAKGKRPVAAVAPAAMSAGAAGKGRPIASKKTNANSSSSALGMPA